MRIIKRILLIVFGLAIVAAIVVASLPKPAPVDTATVMRGALRVTVDGDGRTRVQDRYVITAPLYGNLARIELDPGDTLEDATVIARIKPLQPPLLDTRSEAELQSRVKAAQAALKQAEAGADRAKDSHEFAAQEEDRVRGLAKQGIVSATELESAALETRHAAKELESARFGVRVARYEVETANAALGRATSTTEEGSERQFEIKSPVDGRVLKIIRQHEGVVNPGEQLVEIGDPAALEIVVDVLTADAVEIEQGDPVLIERWGGTAPLHGVVRRVEPSAFTKISALGVEEQRVNVIVHIEEEPEVWRRLGDGFRVEVAITVWENDDVVKLPVGALHRMGEHWAVFTVEDGIAVERKVTIGRRSGLEVEVVEGIDAGTEVIVHPADSIQDGVEVAPR
jgi:HlyD family secretion protein